MERKNKSEDMDKLLRIHRNRQKKLFIKAVSFLVGGLSLATTIIILWKQSFFARKFPGFDALFVVLIMVTINFLAHSFELFMAKQKISNLLKFNEKEKKIIDKIVYDALIQIQERGNNAI